jgi:hypothetical protein
MTDKVEEIVELKKEETPVVKPKQEPVKVEQPKRTYCWLVSKADYIVPIRHNGQHIDVQPFGKAKVIRELTTFDPMHAKYLTFVKI